MNPFLSVKRSRSPVVILKETLHKARLTALHAICLQIFRHIAQKSLAIRQYACGISVQSAEKSDYASYAQALFSVSQKRPRTVTGKLPVKLCGGVFDLLFS